MSVPKNYKQILKKYSSSPKKVRDYFSYLPDLINNNMPLDVSIGYLFSQIEIARKMTLYCGIAKRHRVNIDLAWVAVHEAEITRNGFRELYKTIFEKDIPKHITSKVDNVEKVRDDVAQGKRVPDESKREAIVAILQYAELFNGEVGKVAGFEPFGDLRGFKGRAKPLDKSTSRWVLKGMGFNIS